MSTTLEQAGLQNNPSSGVMHTVRTWADMIKLAHSVFALPFAIVATVMASQQAGSGGLSLSQVVLIVLCMVAARSFAMTFNRIADAAIDARNPRTMTRPIPAGLISMRQAWLFTMIAAAMFVLGCAGFWIGHGNRWPLLLAAPVLAYLAGYSLAKRFTALAHFWLGFAIASSPLAAWIAIHPDGVGWSAVILMFASATWIAGFDIIYACQDIEIDRAEGLNSIPARLGVAGALWVSRSCHLATVAALVLLPGTFPLGGLYWAGVVVAALLLCYEQSLVRANDLSRVNLAFFTVNGVVSVIFGVMTIADIYWR